VSPGRKPKAPRTPPAQLIREPHDLVDYTATLWRIHRTAGEHVLPWNTLRTYGPLPSMRWDPHPGAEPISTAEGVLYAAADIGTSLAEVYQTTRVIDTRAGAPTLTAWQPQRGLRLLDLSGTWLLRNSASAALLAAPRSTRHLHDLARTRRPLRPVDIDRAAQHRALECRRRLDTHDAVVLPAADSPAGVVHRPSSSRRNRLSHPLTNPEKGDVITHSTTTADGYGTTRVERAQFNVDTIRIALGRQACTRHLDEL
jgi:hypothetical protein